MNKGHHRFIIRLSHIAPIIALLRLPAHGDEPARDPLDAFR